MAPSGSDRDDDVPPARWYEASQLYDGTDAVASVDADDRHRPARDLFDRLREQRWLVARVVAEIAVLIAGVLLVTGLPVRAPLLGGAMIALGAIALVIDLIVLWRLRRLVGNAWSDLSRPPDP